MKKKISGITKASVAALLAAGVIFPATTSAAPGDIWKLNTDGTKTNLGSGRQIFLQSGLAGLLDIQTNPTNYFYEGPKELYTFSDADSVFNANPNLSTEEIQEKLEQELAGKGEEIPAQTLDIQSVKASTITILPSSDVDTATYKLALDYLDKEGNVIPAAQLPTDLTVSYVDNKDVFNTDGTIKNKDKIPASGSIKVVATVKSTAANINLTQEFEVTVVAANDWASVTDAKLVFNTDVTGTVAVVGDSIKLVPTVATKNDGTKLEGDTAPTDWNTQVKSVTSSNITVLTAAKSSSPNNNDISLTPITAGTATVTVELNSGYKFEKVITVNEEARQATKITAEQEKLTLSSTVSSGNVKVTVVDQYGDPVKGKTVYAYPTATGTKAIVSQAQTSATDEKGEATLSLTALGTATTGTDTVKLSIENDAQKDGLGTLTVEYAKAGNVATYDVRIAADSLSKDATIDTYNTDDNALKLEFIGKDAAGVVAAIYDQTTMGTTYTVSSSDTAIAEASVDGTGKIEVTPVKAGTATIHVKEGNIVRATFEVTVTDSTPAVGTIALKEGAQILVSASTAKTLTADDLKSLISVKNGEKAFDLEVSGSTINVKDGSNNIATIELFSSNSEKLKVSGVEVTPDSLTDADVDLALVAKLVQGGKTIGTTTIPVVVDATAPTATATTVEDGKQAAKKELTTNTGLVFTAKEAGVDGNDITIEIKDDKKPSDAGDVATNGQLEITVSNKDITIELGNTYTSQSEVASTLDDIVNAINSDLQASALVEASVSPVEQATNKGQVESKVNLADGTTELTVTINFSEAVKGKTADTDLTAAATYTYKHDGASDSSITPTVTVAEDKKSVTLVYAITDKTKKLQAGTSKLSIADNKVTDLAGNGLTAGTEFTLQ